MAWEPRIGVNPISWMNDDLPSLGGETPLEVALEEGRRIGYRGFELGNKFPRDPAALRAKLGAFGLECVSGWWSGRLAGRTVEEEIREVERHAALLAESGATVMVYGEVQDAIQGEIAVPLHKRPRLRGADAWKAYGERVTALARHLLARGVRLAYHHHMGAYVESPADVDALVAATGEEVGLLLDTGHAAFAGGDPLELLRRHGPRVCHVHLKDVRPAVMRLARNRAWSFLQAVLNGVFTVPGDGAIDFRAVLALLRQQGYRGWLVVEAEQDPAVAPSYAMAEKGFRHVDGIVRALDAGQEAA
ncbi:myo-inosose-2 dehydratase [Anaeromyxobacter oryzae]|uniref:Myo-inosose-2 dehydratase n=1 Tax=Anaeromyxobacter oryzae TaxID=2918170 RepID=A0ABM7X0S5_9BACT|nr:myo-inosose-2 dehydratase [Anaeromyxobacter oryzae]BDG05394.1 myo-inosose-2 dehydratase [Anaeromyxobacter oryzae]